MKSTTFYYTTSDNVRIFTYKWIPDEGIKTLGVIQIAHGMAEHAQRYAHFAEFLTKNGFIVYANDHRGHGQTATNENEIGYFSSHNGWFKVVDDMFLLTQLIKENHSNLPVFIFGHSMGSLLTRTYICKYPTYVNGVILSGTAGNAGIVRYIAKLIVFLFINFKWKRARVRLLDNMSFGSFNNKIKNARTKFDWLSNDSKIVDAYIKDPLCGSLFTVKFFDDLLTGLGFIFRNKNINNIPKTFPLYIISGEKDPVGDFGKGVRFSLKKYKKNGITDIEMKLYEAMRHEIINEIGKERVYDDILNWIQKRINK